VINRSKWMQELANKLAKKTLREIVIPGAHDAGTAMISSSSTWSPETPGAEHIVSRSLVADWSRAQGMSLYALLMSGIRYLDLRVAKSDEDGQLYFTHSLLGASVLKELYEVAAFLKRQPKEIVILDFQHFYGMASADHVRLARNLDSIFRNKLVTSPKPGSSLPIADEIWSEARQVVTLYSQESGGTAALQLNPRLWDRARLIQSNWCETIDINSLRSCLEHDVIYPPSPSMLFVLQAILSPDWWTIFKSGVPFVGGLRSLRELATLYNGTICSWFIGPWANRNTNIILADWIEIGDVVGKAIQLNSR
jgi:hypothetical protein